MGIICGYYTCENNTALLAHTQASSLVTNGSIPTSFRTTSLVHVLRSSQAAEEYMRPSAPFSKVFAWIAESFSTSSDHYDHPPDT